MKKSLIKNILITGIVAISTVAFSGCNKDKDNDNNQEQTVTEIFANDSILLGKAKIDGNIVTIISRVIIPSGTTLTIPADVVLSTSAGNALIVNGTLRIEEEAKFIVQEYSAFSVDASGRVYKGTTSSAEGLTATVSGSGEGNCFRIEDDPRYTYYLVHKSTSGNNISVIMGNLYIRAATSGLSAIVTSSTLTQKNTIQTGTAIVTFQ